MGVIPLSANLVKYIRTTEHMKTHPLRGAIFENFVIAELIKSRLNKGERPQLYFWRDSNGIEVDVIVEQSGRLMPIEIKSGKTVTREAFAGLNKWLGLAGAAAMEPTLIYGGVDNYSHNGIQVVGWNNTGGFC